MGNCQQVAKTRIRPTRNYYLQRDEKLEFNWESKGWNLVLSTYHPIRLQVDLLVPIQTLVNIPTCVLFPQTEIRSHFGEQPNVPDSHFDEIDFHSYQGKLKTFFLLSVILELRYFRKNLQIDVAIAYMLVYWNSFQILWKHLKYITQHTLENIKQ